MIEGVVFGGWKSPGLEGFVGDGDVARGISEAGGELGPLSGGQEVGDILGGELDNIHEVLRRYKIGAGVLHTLRSCYRKEFSFCCLENFVRVVDTGVNWLKNLCGEAG